MHVKRHRKPRTEVWFSMTKSKLSHSCGTHKSELHFSAFSYRWEFFSGGKPGAAPKTARKEGRKEAESETHRRKSQVQCHGRCVDAIRFPKLPPVTTDVAQQLYPFVFVLQRRVRNRADHFLFLCENSSGTKWTTTATIQKQVHIHFRTQHPPYQDTCANIV